MRKSVSLCLIVCLLINTGCVSKRKVSVEAPQKGDLLEAVKQPIYSVNLIKKEIPEHLRELDEVYQTPEDCDAFWQEIALLDEILGEDLIDKPDSEREPITVHLGQMLGDQVESNIPFNGIIRSLSGAKKHEKKRLSALLRGKTRRSYLRGWGDAADCRKVNEPETAQEPSSSE